ncbi:unnamed protein product [Mytilus coruscus]|uniref:Ion transport domain-containing protein n=1 Tax=Mytilus coruscus TaxID=42192 RepID=A0A6J8B3K6_MYTCO|nr:unnamed protein product [Mytilus coruscus]
MSLHTIYVGTEPSKCTNDPQLYTNGEMERCAETNQFNSLLLAVYLILTNILLVNLLIAMFSRTFDQVQDNSEMIWKFHRYALVKEYYYRPMFPIPVVIHFSRVVRFCYDKIVKKAFSSAFISTYDRETVEKLHVVEKIALDNYENRHQRARGSHIPRDMMTDESGIRKAKQLTLQELRTPKVKDTDENLKKIPFVSTHDPYLPNVFNAIKSNLPILHESETMKQLIPEGNLIFSRRQPKNLKKHLIRARFEPKVSSDFEIKSCGNSRYGVCGHDFKYLETGKMKTFKDGRKFHVNANIKCKTTNLIYCVTCPGCHEHYIDGPGIASVNDCVHKEQN